MSEEEPKADPFALDLSESQVLWEKYSLLKKIPAPIPTDPNPHGAWIDGFMHSRGWRFDASKGNATYGTVRAYELHPHALKELEEIRHILNVVNDPSVIVEAVREVRNKLHAATHALKTISDVEDQPIPMLLWCPGCSARHIDVGVFETKLHHTHACQECGMVWRPAICNTKGVQFLPGFKNG